MIREDQVEKAIDLIKDFKLSYMGINLDKRKKKQ
jgi:hypothetical protein